MTVPPRGARSRRGGRRPGWLSLTALLVLAIVASSTLVFTNRVELLRLAVILSLWAAVLAAFVSVIYRRQSQIDEARARDMKFVYDLQLDREISARREYELSVESHLRRALTQELRAEAADELAALRAELVSLRANLEALLGTDFADRPALESDREPLVEPVSMGMPPRPDRVESSRVTAVVTEEVTARVEVLEEVTEAVVEEVVETPAAESPIIDVPEEPLVPPRPPVQETFRPAPERRGAHWRAEPPVEPSRTEPPAEPWRAEPAAEPWRAEPAAEAWRAEPAPQSWRAEPPAAPVPPWRPPETQTRRGRHSTSEDTSVPSAPPPPAAPPPTPPTPPPAPTPPPPPRPTSPTPTPAWQPPAWEPPAWQPPAWEPPGQPAAWQAGANGQPPRGRHSVEEPAPAPAAPSGRHRDPEEPAADTAADTAAEGQHTGGQSVADLMARLQADGRAGGGGRRRRED